MDRGYETRRKVNGQKGKQENEYVGGFLNQTVSQESHGMNVGERIC